jgi:hypothetical protein
VGPPRAGQGAVPPVCAGRVGGHGPAPGGREPRERRRDLELHTIGDQTRFTMVHRAPAAAAGPAAGRAAKAAKAAPAAAPANGRGAKRPAARPAAARKAAPPRAKRPHARPPAPRRRGSSPAAPEVQPRQARLRAHLRRPRRRRRGRSRSRVLYWFRTPPGVKVGRAALDPEAIRLIEERNPDVVFDWPRILKGEGRPAERRGRA